MASPSPLEFDTFYHIYSRGNNGQDIFFEDRNYVFFIERYKKYISPIADTFAYCLLKNHFHLLVKIRPVEGIVSLSSLQEPDVDISKVPSLHFSNFLNSYGKAMNKSYDHTGSLFQHPFGRKMIVDNMQLYRTAAYIHQNPIKHQLAINRMDWKWSSFNEVFEGKSQLIKATSLDDFFGGYMNYLSIEYPLESFSGIDDFKD